MLKSCILKIENLAIDFSDDLALLFEHTMQNAIGRVLNHTMTTDDTRPL